jgi:hypothetical protein
LISAQLSPNVVQAMVDAERFRIDAQRDDGLGGRDYLGRLCEPHPRYLDRAKPFLGTWLPNIVRAVEARKLLFDVACMPTRSISPAHANAMLHFLFGAMGKRRNDEAAAKLFACCDVFSPASNALGEALGLWKPAPTHPVIVALAIKQLLAAKTFEPAEVELREALAKVHQRLQMLQVWTDRWIDKLNHADRTVFTFDRSAWDAAYANVPSTVPRTMQRDLELIHEQGGEDDDGVQHPPSPRWQALADLIEAKRAVEQVAEESKPKRLAACKANPPKRKARSRD